MSTPSLPSFILDSSILIHSFNWYYAPKFTEFFWTEIMRLTSEGRILILDKVRDELKKQDT